MRQIAALALLVVAAGCGSAAAVQSSGGSQAPIVADVTLRAPIGQPTHDRSVAEAACAAAIQDGRTCKVIHPVGNPQLWWAFTARRLVCRTQASPDCSRLQVLVSHLRSAHPVCMCAMEFAPSFRIDGRYHGRALRLAFDWCTLCGAPAAAQHALRELFPAAA
jgi:hypothetical protein